MTHASLPVFDKTLQLTDTWLKDLMERMDWQDRHRAYAALRSSLHALRDRLSVNEAAHLGAQLPMLVRGFYYEGWHPAGTPKSERTKEEFLSHIREAFRRDPDFDAEATVRAVFSLLAQRISEGEIEDITRVLPEEIRGLWPSHSE